MPQEDIRTVCRIRPLQVDNGAAGGGSAVKNRVVNRCVALDQRSNNRRVVYTHQPTGKNANGRTNSRQGALAATAPEDTVLAFDYVAGETGSQQELYEQVGRPVVTSCLQGYNGTILCYGQTASG
jgi:hypothetical protein